MRSGAFAGGLSVFQSSFSKQTARQELEESYDSLVVPFRASLDTPDASSQKQPSPGPSSREVEPAEMSGTHQSREGAASAASGWETSLVGDREAGLGGGGQRVEVTFSAEDQALEVSRSR